MCLWVGPKVPSFARQLLVDDQPFRISLTKGGIVPASLWYNRLTPVA